MRILNILQKNINQFVKFAVVGCSNTIINLFVYYLLLYFGIHYILSYTLGFLISVCNAFYWNNKYVFKNKQEKSLAKAFIKVFASYGVSYFISIFLMEVLVDKLGISAYIAPLLKMCITIPLNFILNKVWAFRDNSVFKINE